MSKVLAVVMAMTMTAGLVGCAKDPAPPAPQVLFELIAKPNEDIVMKGVASLKVYAPPQAQAAQAEHWGVTVAKAGLTAATTVLSLYAGGQALGNLVETVAKYSGHNVIGSFNPYTNTLIQQTSVSAPLP